MLRFMIACLSVVAVFDSGNRVCWGQGLLWSLPPDGALVRYEGDYTQVVRRPDSTEGDLSLQWRRYLTIKSVGQLDVTISGEVAPVPCRWIEIKVETGEISEGLIDAGPGGIRIYKLLVREDAIQGTLEHEVPNVGTIFVSFIPLVRGTIVTQDANGNDRVSQVGPGWRKIGELPAEPIEVDVFQLYPAVSLLRHYRELTPQGEPQAVQTRVGDRLSRRYDGSIVMETAGHRSRNTAELWRSDEVPFGLVRWTASTATDRKVSVDPRTSFQETVRISESMNLIEVELEDAETELVTDDDF